MRSSLASGSGRVSVCIVRLRLLPLSDLPLVRLIFVHGGYSLAFAGVSFFSNIGVGSIRRYDGCPFDQYCIPDAVFFDGLRIVLDNNDLKWSVCF